MVAATPIEAVDGAVSIENQFKTLTRSTSPRAGYAALFWHHRSMLSMLHDGDARSTTQ
jgi:hypothetical protein